MKTIGSIAPYKLATVYDGPNEQFLYFSYWSKQKKKYIREKVRYNIGVKVSRADRLKGLTRMCEKINIVLHDRNMKNQYHEDIVIINKNNIAASFVNWIEYILLEHNPDMADSTKKLIHALHFSYSKFLEVNPIFEHNIPEQITQPVLIEYTRYLKAENKTGKTINAYLGAIKTISEILVERGVLNATIETERYRVKQVKNESGKFRPLTDLEKGKIFDYLRAKDNPFYIYVLCIYYTCIRPIELTRLKVENFDLKARQIYIPFYSSKNGLSNYVQILQPLYNALKDYKIDDLPTDFYLFSKGTRPGLGKYNNKYASDKWREACRQIGLDESVNMYGLKHTFNVDYIEKNRKNIDWEFLRNHNRHATVQQTQQYISGLTAYFLDETKAVIMDYHVKNNT